MKKKWPNTTRVLFHALDMQSGWQTLCNFDFCIDWNKKEKFGKSQL